MRAVGIVAVSLVGVLAVCAAVVGVRSIPDIQRYLKMRRM
ncbi:MAG: hypothetical protein QOG10_4340 [Kribbellaceae bacterium]|jgi:hypothetical protein|nr:hypothetical protein [Kribbellaceae bacterium]